MLRLRLSWTRWSRKRAINRLAREKRRLVMLQELVQDQADRVQWLMLETHQPPPTPQPKVMELPPPTPTPLFRGTPPLVTEPEEPTEPMPDPMAELGQRLGLPAQQS